MLLLAITCNWIFQWHKALQKKKKVEKYFVAFIHGKHHLLYPLPFTVIIIYRKLSRSWQPSISQTKFQIATSRWWPPRSTQFSSQFCSFFHEKTYVRVNWGRSTPFHTRSQWGRVSFVLWGVPIMARFSYGCFWTAEYLPCWWGLWHIVSAKL